MKKSLIVGIIAVIAIVLIVVFAMRRDNDSNVPANTSTSTDMSSTTPTTQNPPAPTNNPPQPAAPSVVTNNNAAVSNSSAVVSGSVTPNGATTMYWFEYGKTNNFGSRTVSQSIGSGFKSIPAPGYIAGLSASTHYFFRLAASNSRGAVSGQTFEFTTSNVPPVTPQGKVPTAQTNAASALGNTSATLNGRVNPNGNQTSYWFEYGQTTNLGEVSAFQSAGSASASAPVSLSLSGLAPGTKYYFRVNAQNAFGTVNGTVMSFTTKGSAPASAPSASTLDATNVARTTATLNGVVNPNGNQTSYWFEYSSNSLLGSIVGTATPTRSAGADNNSNAVSANVTGLAPGTQYYVRLVARNSDGTTRGDVMNFTTNP